MPRGSTSRGKLGTFTVRDGRIVELYFLTDPKRLAQLDLSVIGL